MLTIWTQCPPDFVTSLNPIQNRLTLHGIYKLLYLLNEVQTTTQPGHSRDVYY